MRAVDQKMQKPDERTSEMLAPDGTWGIIVVVICGSMLAFLVFVPARVGASPSSKFWLAGLVVIWMSSGIRRIVAARAWRKRHGRPKA